MGWLDRLERKLRRFCIPNLMTYIVIGMALVFVADMLLPVNLYGLLSLDMSKVAAGEVWRLITFVFLPPSTSLIWIIFSLYFYWMIGSGLEAQWGSFRFNVFYLVGVLGSIVSALITGSAVNTYLNLSLFLAFAAVYPNFEVRVFMILPVKMKYLALLDLVLYVWLFITGKWDTRLAILFSLANVILFFGGHFIRYIKQDSQYWKTRYTFRKAMRENKRKQKRDGF